MLQYYIQKCKLYTFLEILILMLKLKYIKFCFFRINFNFVSMIIYNKWKILIKIFLNLSFTEFGIISIFVKIIFKKHFLIYDPNT